MPFQDRYVFEKMRHIVLLKAQLIDMPLSHFSYSSLTPHFSRFSKGYTGHSFNDFNHVDLTTMLDQVSDNENNGEVYLAFVDENIILSQMNESHFLLLVIRYEALRLGIT